MLSNRGASPVQILDCASRLHGVGFRTCGCFHDVCDFAAVTIPYVQRSLNDLPGQFASDLIDVGFSRALNPKAQTPCGLASLCVCLSPQGFIELL